MSETGELQQDPESLVQRYIENPREDLKDLIILQYASMVERIARRFAGLEPLEDLVQVGFVGLLNALSKFDMAAGVRFNTYATYLVAGEIKHYLRDRTQTIRHPAWLQELRHKVLRAQNVLQQELARNPSERELADYLGISEGSVQEVFQTQEMLKVASLDSAAPGTDDDGDSEVEKLDAAAFCPEQLSLEDRMVLEHAMKQLRELEREVLVLFHFDSMNQTEIAAKLNISCNYVSHILRQSLAKLRKILVSEGEKDRVLRRQANALEYDVIEPTTGAYTEAFFKTRLEEEIHRASCEGHVMGLMLINFHGLETLQSFYGEKSVMDFLSDAAEFFRENVRRLDLVCRLGSTGFGILLPSTGKNINQVKDRLVDKMTEWLSVRRFTNSPVRIELGYSSFPEHGRSSRELFHKATPQPFEPNHMKAA